MKRLNRSLVLLTAVGVLASVSGIAVAETEMQPLEIERAEVNQGHGLGDPVSASESPSVVDSRRRAPDPGLLLNDTERRHARNMQGPEPVYGTPPGVRSSDPQPDIAAQIDRVGLLLQAQNQGQQAPDKENPPLQSRTKPLPRDGTELPGTVTDDPESWTEDPGDEDDYGTIEIGDPPSSIPGLDIHPIQVIQGGYAEKREKTPLIEDKLTMVRVFVELPKGSMKINGAKCVLDWAGSKYTVTGDLETDPRGRTLVRKQSNRSDLTPGLNGSTDANWAFNFIFKGKGDSFGLKMPATLTLTATLYYPNGQKMAEATESSGSEFTIQKSKPFHVRLVLQSQGGAFKTGMGPNGRKKFQNEFENKVRRSILARYPIPASRLQTSWGKKALSRRKPGESIEQHLDRIAARTAVTQGKDFDAIFVVTEKIDLKDGQKTLTPSGFTPNDPATGKTGKIHFLFAGGNKYYTEPTPAHEIGHQTRFFGAAHSDGKVDDAWDAGGYWKNDALTTFSMEGFSKLMKENELQQWVDLKEYRALCLELKAGA